MKTLIAALLLASASVALAEVCYPGAPMAPSMPGCYNICVCENGVCRVVTVCK